MPEQFSEEEKKILQGFCSNIDKGIFVLHNLPEVIKGALFSRYSRSTKSLRRLLLDEFILDKEIGFASITGEKTGNVVALKEAVKKAQAFYDRVLDGYGDDSVGELGGAHIACEHVSIIASKILEDARIGGSPLEKSTRYVYFNDKIDGEYQFYREPTLMASEFAGLYAAINNLLFDTYTELLESLKVFLAQHLPLDEFEFFDIHTKQNTKFKNLSDEKLIKRARIAYTGALRAKACDILRGLLPASTKTNLGIFGNGRFFQTLLTKMYTSPLAEITALAKTMHEELDTTIPSFVRRAKLDEFLQKMDREIRDITLQQTNTEKMNSEAGTTLVEYDADAENKVAAALLYANSHLSLKQLQQKVRTMGEEEKKKIIQPYFDNRRQRRDKLPRAFENVYYTFDVLADYGIYRDLHRHRVLTQERQLLTTLHGYTEPEELEMAGLGEDYRAAMEAAAVAFERIVKKYPFEAQYVVPLAYNIRWYMKMNLRQAYHFCELRAGQQGHIGYRRVAQDMAKAIKEVHPFLGEGMKFVDFNAYQLERMNAEMRKEEKREAWEANVQNR